MSSEIGSKNVHTFAIYSNDTVFFYINLYFLVQVWKYKYSYIWLGLLDVRRTPFHLTLPDSALGFDFVQTQQGNYVVAQHFVSSHFPLELSQRMSLMTLMPVPFAAPHKPPIGPLRSPTLSALQHVHQLVVLQECRD